MFYYKFSQISLLLLLSYSSNLRKERVTYPLSLQMCTSQTVMMFIEVHHLETIELIRDFFDFLYFRQAGRLRRLVRPYVFVRLDRVQVVCRFKTKKYCLLLRKGSKEGKRTI